MLVRAQTMWRQYPRTLWVLAGGLFFTVAGMSMVWPFFPMYATARLHLDLTSVGTLITVQAIAGIVGSVLGGALVDRWGRKPGMLLSLLGLGVSYLSLIFARTWMHLALVMLVGGGLGPSFRIAGDAMTADLLPPDQRDNAYALLRVANNLGIALGPALGGALISIAYEVTFLAAAGALFLYMLVVWVAIHETHHPATQEQAATDGVEAYRAMLRDRRLWGFLLPVFLAWTAGGCIWVFLGVYMRDAHGLGEQAFGFVVSINALLVVIFQVALTRLVRRFRGWRMAMVLGALFYAAALAATAYARTLGEFLTVMVVLTIGEMLMVPTASTWIANFAPAHLRGRYMAALAVIWPLAAGTVGPVGGWLIEHFSFTALWMAAAALGLLAALGFLPQTPPPME